MKLNKQIDLIKENFFKNQFLAEIYNRYDEINLPNWYLGAGCIAQTIWNVFSGFAPNVNIKDVDIAYFDSSDLSKKSEELKEKEIQKKFKSLPIKFDVKNQARVHLWYKDCFGYDIQPYSSVENAINTWPTTATSLGMKKENDNFVLYSPHGLSDLLDMVVRPNKAQITKEIQRWKECWPKLKIVSW
ncbi:nucleotidyltransferase family protein [Candidatus Babeliales bacterium]|nr:nucleotidyltransferase family protein [Candidatus Babeliales bacterium]